jgi:chorismate mutase
VRSIPFHDESIKKLRHQIDELDRELVRILNKRTQCAIEIGRIKAAHEIPVYDPEREAIVAKNAGFASDGPLSRAAVERVFERIMDETRRSERKDRDTVMDSEVNTTSKDQKP